MEQISTSINNKEYILINKADNTYQIFTSLCKTIEEAHKQFRNGVKDLTICKKLYVDSDKQYHPKRLFRMVEGIYYYFELRPSTITWDEMVATRRFLDV